MSDAGTTPTRRLRDLLEALSYLAVIGGVLVGFSEHFSGKAASTRAVAEHVYDALDAEYRQMLALQISQPHLSHLVRLTGGLPVDVTPAEHAQVHSYFALAIDLYERAYLGYHDTERSALVSAETLAQWGGWEDSIDEDIHNSEFVHTWQAIGAGFDDRFQAWLNARLEAMAPAER